MDVQQALLGADLNKKEVQVYLALLENGEITATKISQLTTIDRTLIYHITNKLIDKGFVAFLIKEKIKYFSAAEPRILLESLQEREKKLKEVLPQLIAKKESTRQDTTVQLYKGQKGIYSIYRMIVAEGKPYCFLGGVEQACKEFPIENAKTCNEIKDLNILGRVLVRKGEYFFCSETDEYRYLPPEVFSSTTMVLFGSKTAIFVWSQTPHIILIDNKEVTESNLAHFNYLWQMAEEPTVEDIAKKRKELKRVSGILDDKVFENG